MIKKSLEQVRVGPKEKKIQGKQISITDLSVGDFVVHENYGDRSV